MSNPARAKVERSQGGATVTREALSQLQLPPDVPAECPHCTCRIGQQKQIVLANLIDERIEPERFGKGQCLLVPALIGQCAPRRPGHATARGVRRRDEAFVGARGGEGNSALSGWCHNLSLC